MNKYKLGQSKEDYLEAILMIKKDKGKCYSIDIANRLNFSRPSVSVAVKSLENDGYITKYKDGELNLTEKGNQIADSVMERHNLITQIFTSIGISEKTAEEDACSIEHFLSDETFDCIRKHLNKAKGQ